MQTCGTKCVSYVRPCTIHLTVDFEIASINAFHNTSLLQRFKAVFFSSMSKCRRKVQQLGLGTRYKMSNSQWRAHATCPRVCNSLWHTWTFQHSILTTTCGGLRSGIIFEATYIGRNIANSPLMSSPLFPMEKLEKPLHGSASIAKDE